MARVEIPDAGGDTMSYLNFGQGKQLLCTLLENIDFAGIKAMRMRDDDVILCSYPRSGCHWLWEQLRLLTTGTVHVDSTDKDDAMFEFNSRGGKLDQQPSPRVLNTHLYFAQLPAEVVVRRTKLVLLYRNPKDVCVSWYMLHRQGPWYNYQGQFHNWVQPFLEGNVDWGAYSRWIMEWERTIQQHPQHPIHVLSYEDLKQNPIKELTSLSRFLGRPHDVTFLRAVSDACAIDNMRARKEEKAKAWWKENGVSDTNSFMYRQGKSGGWKQWFTVAQSDEFDLQWSMATMGATVFKFSREEEAGNRTRHDCDEEMTQ